MPWIKIVFYILMNAPAFIKVIGQILALFKNLPKEQQVSVKGQIEEAIAHHKQTGDDSKLKKVCEGIGCPPGLVVEP